MIVRLMGEGQFTLPEGFLPALNELDDAAVAALGREDEIDLRRQLDELHAFVRREGTRLPDAHLAPSDLIIPPADLSLDEGRRLLTSEGLIPDLPVAV